ncbi:MAG: PLP-dependent transferase, partial [Planctomycetaceae bacterium]|nr:PLP-dependent transferase [Planctomycetaceae bacterium]
MHFRTKAIHVGNPTDRATGAVVPPIYVASTFVMEEAGKPQEYDYSRSGNPTRKALEDCIAALEGGEHGFVFGTGMAAETTFFALYGA